MIRLTRAAINRTDNGLDVTRKSGEGLGLVFAPTWDMIRAHKTNTISDGTYTKKYLEILAGIPEDLYAELYRFGALSTQPSGVLTFLCYCRDGKFCHTYLLMNYLIERFPNHFSY